MARREMNEQMIQSQIVARGVRDPRVLGAFRSAPREQFVPPELSAQAYEDSPLPIGYDQTISQPYIVAYMTEALDVRPGHRVLEIGTGSGYQTAILAQLARRVYSAEIVPQLAEQARTRLQNLGYENVEVKSGNALEVFAHEAPFDRILSAAAPGDLPGQVVDQLAEGGRCLIPVGSWSQSLWMIEKKVGGKVEQKELLPVRFVPLRT